MAYADYFYTTGTASIANGSKALTGVGTAWQLRNVVGAILFIGNSFGFVQTVQSETGATLADNWTGPTAVNQPYRMWLVPADAATALVNNTRLAEIIASIDDAQPESEILSALAGLALAANKLPYGTGATTMALTDLTSVGRGIIGQANTADMRTYIGAQTAASSLTALSGIATASFGIGLLAQASGAATINYITGLTTTPYGRGLLDRANGAAVYSYLGNIPGGTVADGSLHWVVSNANHAVNAIPGGSVRSDGSIEACANGAPVLFLTRSTSSGQLAQFRAHTTFCGGMTVSAGTASMTFDTTSDYRMKSNIRDLEGSGEFIDSLRPRRFVMGEDKVDQAGFIAHEFSEVSPISVNGKKDAVDEAGKPVYQTMQASTSDVMANIVAELQSLRNRVAELEGKLNGN